MRHAITDWTAAYDNTANIPNGAAWPGVWIEPAARFRTTHAAGGRFTPAIPYGPGPREVFDLFLPENSPPRGLVVFVHGGFWMALDRSYWSHLAAGPLAHGYAVAVPSYTLAPEIRIAGITRQIGAAITAAAGRIAGPIRLIGHSAGGQLVTRMLSHTSPLAPGLRERIVQTVSLSGLHDLRMMLNISRNTTLMIDMEEALAESPALLTPLPGTRVTCWVGARETSEFLRQNSLLANIWKGLGAATDCVEEPDRHHFNVMDGLMQARHPLTMALMAD
jgi:arylformamidase